MKFSKHIVLGLVLASAIFAGEFEDFLNQEFNYSQTHVWVDPSSQYADDREVMSEHVPWLYQLYVSVNGTYAEHIQNHTDNPPDPTGVFTEKDAEDLFKVHTHSLDNVGNYSSIRSFHWADNNAAKNNPPSFSTEKFWSLREFPEQLAALKSHVHHDNQIIGDFYCEQCFSRAYAIMKLTPLMQAAVATAPRTALRK